MTDRVRIKWVDETKYSHAELALMEQKRLYAAIVLLLMKLMDGVKLEKPEVIITEEELLFAWDNNLWAIIEPQKDEDGEYHSLLVKAVKMPKEDEDEQLDKH